jgi:hypothetical protein
MTQAGVLVPGRIRFAWFAFRTRDTERCGFPNPRWDGAIGESNEHSRRSFRSEWLNKFLIVHKIGVLSHTRRLRRLAFVARPAFT